MEESSRGAVLVSHTRGQQEAIFTVEPAVAEDADSGQKDSLFQMIERLSEAAERRSPQSCLLSGRKRPRLPRGPKTVTGSPGGSPKKPKEAAGSEHAGGGGWMEGRLSGGHMTNGPTKESVGNMEMAVEFSGAGMVSMGSGETQPSSGGAEGALLQEQWYSQEQGGAYRCLICSYVCGQQRTLKTHAWKHAGLLRCSYPVFEDGPEATPLPPPQGAGSTPASVGPTPASVGSTPASVGPTPANVGRREPELNGRRGAETVPAVLIAKETAVELQVAVEMEPEAGEGGCPPGSAQLVLGGRWDIAGRLSVGQERRPEEEGMLTGEAFPMHPDTDTGPFPLHEEEEGEQEEEEEDIPEASVAEEKVPASRRRTQSECLRLHSLAAEALVAMPMTASGPTFPSHAAARFPEAGRDPAAFTTPPAPPTSPASSQDPVREGVAESPAQAGISQSLLAVIEKLRERTNENDSDEDILRELRDNAQGLPIAEVAPPQGDLALAHPSSKRPRPCQRRGCSDDSQGCAKRRPWAHVCEQPCQHVPRDGKDLENHVTQRCRTRVHCCGQQRKRRLQNHESSQHGYEETLATMVPVMETMVIADDSLEKKAAEEEFQGQRVYQCDVCAYTSSTYTGVRNHQRIHSSDNPYRCCSCDFATTSVNNMRNHMWRHPQDHQTVQQLEQYRCSLCGYVCSHPPSLKSHMWKHAGDQNYNYQQVTRAIDQAISLSCRPPRNAGPGLEPWRHACVGEDDAGKAAPCLDPRAVGEAAQVYCVLRFCCVCGFESPSREQLLEHMKDHEGQIVGIVQSQGAASPPAGY